MNLTSFIHLLNFVIIRGVVSFILVTGVQKPPKPLDLSQKMRVRRTLAPKCASFLSLCRKGAQVRRVRRLLASYPSYPFAAPFCPQVLRPFVPS